MYSLFLTSNKKKKTLSEVYKEYVVQQRAKVVPSRLSRKKKRAQTLRNRTLASIAAKAEATPAKIQEKGSRAKLVKSFSARVEAANQLISSEAGRLLGWLIPVALFQQKQKDKRVKAAGRRTAKVIKKIKEFAARTAQELQTLRSDAVLYKVNRVSKITMYRAQLSNQESRTRRRAQR